MKNTINLKQIISKFKWFIIMILIAIGLTIPYFILLMLRGDRILYLNFLQINIISIVAFCIGIIYFIIKLIYWRKYILLVLNYIGMIVLLSGSLASIILLSNKFDNDATLTFWQSLLPFLSTLIFSGILFIITLSIMIYKLSHIKLLK